MSEVPLYQDLRTNLLSSAVGGPSNWTNSAFLAPIHPPCLPTHEHQYITLSFKIQGYLAHKKTPTPVGPPSDPRHRPTVGS